ncbi:MAG TPA: enoyl-CoA hydratase/isomerase family protein [Dermatophilaceae bacterium]|nr:enoyl-CoA hydratase/isomerase family protein [Dermatophilaceae bacterium]
MPLTTIRREGQVTIIGLDRPEKMNALDQALCDELTEVLRELKNEPSVLVIHSTTPGVFVAGADIAELIERDAEIGMRGVNAQLFERLEEHRWPTIAAIDGPALGGGCELALACDLRVASTRSRFGQPELGLGILAGAGGNWRLAQAVGVPTARRMLYSGELLSAEQAHAAGLVDRLVEPEHVLDSAIELAQRIARQSWRALELTKIAMRLHRPATTLYDQTAQALLFESADKRERMQAFLDERARRRAERAAARSASAATTSDPATRHTEGDQA